LLDFKPIPDTICTVAESPVWDAVNQALLWCDIPKGQIFELNWQSGTRRSWTLPGPVGSFGLAQGQHLIIACQHDILFLNRDTGGITHFATIPETGTRLNDGKTGPDGAFWVGSMDDTPAKQPVAALYRVTPDGRVERKLSGLITSNGLAWSADGKKMYHSDSRGQRLDVWDFSPATGGMTNRKQIAELNDAQGRPDGGATDTAGIYWSAGVTAGLLNRFTAEGEMLPAIPFPAAAPTMPCFGGEDLKTLFVTSLRGPAAADRPDGSVFFTRVATPGVPIPRFKG